MCDQRIQPHLGTFADQREGQPCPPKARRHKKVNEPRFDARTPLYRLAGVDLTTIEGIAEGTALVILAEIGTAMSRWPSVKHCCSGLGLSPQPTISGGRVLSRRVRPGAHRVAVALRLAARTIQQARTALGAFERRMRRRLGAPKAMTATAPTLARLVYSLLQHGSAYVQQGREAYESQYRERQIKARARQATALGYTLVALGTPEVPSLDTVAAPTPCADTTPPPCLIAWGGTGGVSAQARTAPAERPATARHDSTHSATPPTRTGIVPWEGALP